MSTRAVSRLCGILYVFTVSTFIVSNLFLKEKLVDIESISNTFRLVADNASQYRLAVSIDFMGLVAVMALAFSLFYILKPVSPYLALLALGWRIGEVVLQAAAKVPDYLLLTLSQAAVSSPGNGVADVDHLGRMLTDASTQGVWLGFVFLSVGSIFNNYLFYRSRAIPAGLAVYGLISTALYTVGSILPLFIDLPEGTDLGLMLPLVAFELALGFYLALFGIKNETS